jgi:hypothetical protein
VRSPHLATAPPRPPDFVAPCSYERVGLLP